MITVALTDKAGLRLIGQVAKLSVAEARALITSENRFDEAEISDLLTICKQSKTILSAKKDGYFKQRQKGLAALWILGASWGQLAVIYEVSRQTVMESANRVLRADRLRMATKCLHERVSEYNAQYWTAVGQNIFHPDLTAHEIAGWLASNTGTDNDN